MGKQRPASVTASVLCSSFPDSIYRYPTSLEMTRTSHLLMTSVMLLVSLCLVKSSNHQCWDECPEYGVYGQTLYNSCKGCGWFLVCLGQMAGTLGQCGGTQQFDGNQGICVDHSSTC